jgi:transposase InsO family protein
VTEVGPRLGIAPTCAALGVPRATYYRRRRPQNAPPRRRPFPRALSDAERTAVLAVLHEPRFVDLPPAEVYATLLDEGRYLCSERTMYRVLAGHQEVRERRDQLRHPRYAAPELLAQRPNELWSWDITKLLGPAKWTYFYLYVMLDVFSRYVVGWMVAQSIMGRRLADQHALLNHLIRPQQQCLRDRQARTLAVLRLITSSNFVGCSTGRWSSPPNLRVSESAASC